jgi:heme-degrading monooxygenase HmoA
MNDLSPTIYTASFIFEPGTYDDAFHALDALIEDAARATPGYLGSETWLATEGARRNAVYYWQTLEALKSFSNHPKHLEAKRQYLKWYKSFHIVIAQVLRLYGDGGLSHITPNERISKT